MAAVKSPAVLCQLCGVEAPTKATEFYQNIGALVVRFHKSAKGHMCKRCVHKKFWSMTGTNLVLGWWGYISIFVNTAFVLSNIFRYAAAAGMKPVPPGARVPVLTDAIIEKVAPHRDELLRRVNGGEDFNDVARDLAGRAGVTPGEVVHYLMAVVRALRQQQAGQVPTFGFPVVLQPDQQPAAAATPAIPVGAPSGEVAAR